jgi:hypothetical protein
MIAVERIALMVTVSAALWVASPTAVACAQTRVDQLIAAVDADRGRPDALGELARLGPEARAALPVLVKVLRESGNPYMVLNTLAAIGPDALPAAPAIIDTLQGASAGSCRLCDRVAMDCLGNMGPGVVPVLFAAIGEGDADGILILVPDIVGKVGVGAIPALLVALNDTPLRRHAAVGAFGVLGPDGAPGAPILVEYLERDALLRDTAARALREIGTGAVAVVPRLIVLSGHADSDVRRAAVTILAAIGPGAQAAVPVLEELQARDAALATEAADALRRIREHKQD